MFSNVMSGVIAAAVMLTGAAAEKSCGPPPAHGSTPAAASSQHTAKPAPAKRGNRVLMPAHSCTLVKYANGDERNVCAPATGDPRAYPPYPVVAHGPGDRVKHVRYPAEWVSGSDSADADAARKAAESGAWD